MRIASNPTGEFTFSVCERFSGGGPFQRSEIFIARTAMTIRTCQFAFGRFSQPYILAVIFKSSISDSSVLTERMIMVVLGTNCNIDDEQLHSRELNVIGMFE